MRDVPYEPAGTSANTSPPAIDWYALVRSEYLEMPGLNPTLAQAERLWNLDPATARAVLTALEEARFLRRTRSGAYVRADSH